MSPIMLTKSNYMSYLRCPQNLWVEKHAPELLPPKEDSLLDSLREGQAVEQEALKLFPQVHVISPGPRERMAAETSDLLSQEGELYLSQATFLTSEGLLAQADLLHRPAGQEAVELYEVKAVSNLNLSEKVPDLAFQRYAAEQAGLLVARTFFIHLNKMYRHEGTLNRVELFTTYDATKEVAEHMDGAFRERVAAALRVVQDTPEHGGKLPQGCECWKHGADQRCPSYEVLNPELVGAQVFDLRVLTRGEKKERFYTEAHERGLRAITDIPEDMYPLMDTASQRIVEDAKQQVISWDAQGLRDVFEQLEYPLYFLDYESVSEIIPRYEGTKPSQAVCFQYSLHVLTAPPGSPGSKLFHKEFLAREQGNPVPELAKALAQAVGPQGSVIVWNESFEKTRNREMGAMVPEYEEFFAQVNQRVFDLMKVVKASKGSPPLYRDYRLLGKSSIKKVLPLVAPELSYAELTIRNGGMAMSEWPRVVYGDVSPEEREQVFQDLYKYCGLDTYAMVRIFEEFYKHAYPTS